MDDLYGFDYKSRNECFVLTNSEVDVRWEAPRRNHTQKVPHSKKKSLSRTFFLFALEYLSEMIVDDIRRAMEEAETEALWWRRIRLRYLELMFRLMTRLKHRSHKNRRLPSGSIYNGRVCRLNKTVRNMIRSTSIVCLADTRLRLRLGRRLSGKVRTQALKCSAREPNTPFALFAHLQRWHSWILISFETIQKHAKAFSRNVGKKAFMEAAVASLSFKNCLAVYSK